METSSNVLSEEEYAQSNEQMDVITPGTSGTGQVTGYIDDSSSNLQMSCEEETSGSQASGTSVFEPEAGPSFMDPEAKRLPKSWEETPEKAVHETSGTVQNRSSSTQTSSELDFSVVGEKMSEYQASMSDTDRIRKAAIAKRPTSFYDLRDTNNSSDDESDVEREINKPFSFRSGRRTFSECDSPEDSDSGFKIYDSEDHSSSEIIGGLSSLHLYDAVQPSLEDEPRRPDTPLERKLTRPMITGVPAITFVEEEVLPEFDPETGERGESAAQIPKDDPDDEEKASHGLLNLPIPISKDISPTKRKAEERDINLESILEDQVSPGKFQESSAKTPVKKQRVSSEYGPEETGEKGANMSKLKDDSDGKEQGSPGLLSPPTRSSRDSTSPSKRKAEELECDPNTASTFQDQVSPGRSEETPTKRPVKKGRVSSEYDPEKTSGKSASPLQVKDDDPDGKKQRLPGLLSPPSHGSRDSISPTKRKAEELELDIESEASSADEVSPGRFQELSSKRTKIKPPTPVTEECDVAKNLKEPEKKSEPKKAT